MRPDSKYITTTRAADGSVTVTLDLRWYAGVQALYGRTTRSIRRLPANGMQPFVIVGPNGAIVPSTFWADDFPLRFTTVRGFGRRRWAFWNHPLRGLADGLPEAYYRNLSASRTKRLSEVAERHMVQRRFARLWNAVLRRVLDYADPDAVRLSRAVHADVAFYNRLVTEPALRARVADYRVAGVAEAWFSDTLRKEVYRAIETDPAFRAYAKGARFTQASFPGAPATPLAIADCVQRALDCLTGLEPELLEHLTGRQRAFLHRLFNECPDTARLVQRFLQEPQAMLDEVTTLRDAQYAKRQKVVRTKAGKASLRWECARAALHDVARSLRTDLNALPLHDADLSLPF